MIRPIMAIVMEEPLSPQEAAAAILADVYRLAGALRRRRDLLAAGSFQSQARWQVLSAASSADRTVPQIARRLGITRQAVQRVAHLLVEEGKARFIWDGDHQHSPLLRLTTAGRDVLDKLTAGAADFHQQLAQGMHPDDLDGTLTVLRQFTARIEHDLSLTEED